MGTEGSFFYRKIEGSGRPAEGGLSIHTTMYASIKKAIADADQERRQDHARRMALLRTRIEAVRRMGAILDAYQDGKKTLQSSFHDEPGRPFLFSCKKN